MEKNETIRKSGEKLSTKQIHLMREKNNSVSIDFVDRSDTVLGKLSRREVLKEGKNYRVAHVMIFHEASNCFMLQKLSSAHIRNSHHLGSSAAGFVHSNETYSQAAHRIIKKELRLTGLKLVPLLKLTMHDENSLKFIQTFFTRTSENPDYDISQVEEIQLMPLVEISQKIEKEPQKFTPTFVFIIKSISDALRSRVDGSRAD